MQALQYPQANAGWLLIDPDRIALAGDSAGAHIAAQAGALVTTPGYAEAVSIPAITVTGHGRCPAQRLVPLQHGRDGPLSIQHCCAERRQYARSPFVVTWFGRTGSNELPRPRAATGFREFLLVLHGPPGETPRTCGGLQENRKSFPGNAESS